MRGVVSLLVRDEDALPLLLGLVGDADGAAGPHGHTTVGAWRRLVAADL